MTMKIIKKEDIELPTLTKMVEEFGKNVRRERRESKLTQKELADKVGITHEWICKIEKGKAKNVSINLMQKISSALGKSLMVVIDDFRDLVD